MQRWLLLSRFTGKSQLRSYVGTGGGLPAGGNDRGGSYCVSLVPSTSIPTKLCMEAELAKKGAANASVTVSQVSWDTWRGCYLLFGQWRDPTWWVIYSYNGRRVKQPPGVIPTVLLSK